MLNRLNNQKGGWLVIDRDGNRIHERKTVVLCQNNYDCLLDDTWVREGDVDMTQAGREREFSKLMITLV